MTTPAINNSTSTASLVGNLGDVIADQEATGAIIDQGIKNLAARQKVVTNPNPPKHQKKNIGYSGSKLSSAINSSASNSTSTTGTNQTSNISSTQYRLGSISNRASARQNPTPSNQITTSKKIVHPGKSSATSQRSARPVKKTTTTTTNTNIEAMSIKSIGVTPYYPQPRKEKRAAAIAGNNARPNNIKT